MLLAEWPKAHTDSWEGMPAFRLLGVLVAPPALGTALNPHHVARCPLPLQKFASELMDYARSLKANTAALLSSSAGEIVWDSYYFVNWTVGAPRAAGTGARSAGGGAPRPRVPLQHEPGPSAHACDARRMPC